VWRAIVFAFALVEVLLFPIRNRELFRNHILYPFWAARRAVSFERKPGPRGWLGEAAAPSRAGQGPGFGTGYRTHGPKT
jgi:hypothetical protein